ncbi:MAG: hypothetical protein ACP5I7_00380 [Sulfolobales archaeon]
MRETVKIVSDIREALERIDLSNMRRSDAQIVGIFKEIISGALNVSEKISCISEAKNLGNISFLCNRKLVLIRTSDAIALNKLTLGRGLSFNLRENELKIYNRGCEMRLTPHQVSIKIQNISRSIDLRKIEGVSEHSSIISKVFGSIIEVINRINEDLSKCIKIERIKC